MQLKEWIDSIRQRPGMYIGSIDEFGIGEIFEHLLEEMLAFREGNPVFEFVLEPDGHLSLVVKGINVIRYTQSIDWHGRDADLDTIGWPCLVALTESLYVELDNGSGMSVYEAKKGLYQQLATGSRWEGQRVKIRCAFDNDIFRQPVVGFSMLIATLRKFSFLYPGIILKVTEQDESRQNLVLHAPGGLVDELKQLMPYGSWRYRRFTPFVLNASMGSRAIDIACCYHEMGNDQITRTFANRAQLFLGGSLLEGILAGITAAGNRMASERGLLVQLDRTNVTRNLLLLAAIKGGDFIFRGSTRWELDMPEVEVAIQQRVDEAFYTHLTNNEAAAWSFLEVFKLKEAEEEEDD